MPFGQYNLSKIQTLQPALRPLAVQLIDLANQQGINVEVVQAYRSPEQQQALYTSGAGVTKAPALSSYHNYGLALDVVPREYISLPGWNPGGPLWAKLGAIGESIGLTWGGRFSTPDYPHFELKAAPLSELKAYWLKFKEVMPISITPTAGGMAMIFLVGIAWLFVVKPMLARKGLT